MNRYRAGLLTATLSMTLVFTGMALAQPGQEPNPNGTNNEMPEHGVARVSLINGDVSVRRGDSDEVVAAALNAPLVAPDRVMTGDGSRAEIQFDSSNMIRLAPFAEVRLAELEYNRYQIQIARGTVMFRVLRDQTAEVELSTPTVSVRPVGRGAYRVTVRDDGTTEITVRAGQVDIFTPQGSERLETGRTMLARGTPAEPEVQVIGAIRQDEWDQWNVRRDSDLEHSRSYQYVSRDVYGAEELDNHGRWVADAEYGNVWSPYASAGWAPYRNGRWVWIDYYGWSWVSYDPWGWAPYHYGRWFYRASNGWCWYPGGLSTRHYWSPALVAFFGFGGGGVGVGFGNIGWVPLAPREPYYRWYGRGYYGGYRNGGYGDRSINIVNNVNISNVYRNARVNNGITAIDHNGFGRGRVGNNIRISGDELNRATLVRGQLPVTPGRDSLRMSDRQAGNFRATPDNTRFANRMQSSQATRIPFEEQRRGMEQASRRVLGDAQQAGGSTPRMSGPDQGGAGRGSVNSRSVGDGGWRRFGEPVPSRGNSAVTAPAQPADRGGSTGRGSFASRSDQSGNWRQFGNGGNTRQDAPASSYRSESQPSSPAATGTRSNDGWRGMSGQGPAFRGNDVQQRQQQQRSAPSSNGWRGDSAPVQRQPMQRNEMQRGPSEASRGGFGRSEAIRISPPIVRERSASPAPRSESRPSNNGGGGGGGRSENSGGHNNGGRNGGGGRGR
jgi:hypothetical protein